MRYVVGIDIGGTNIVSGAWPRTAPGCEGLHDRAHRRRRRPRRRGATGSSRWPRRPWRRPAGSIRRRHLGAGDRLPRSARHPDRRRHPDAQPRLGQHAAPGPAHGAARPPRDLDNDANCALLGEWWQGAARGARHAIGFTLGTGIGGGIIIDGRLHHGASDVAGEFGHITIDTNGRRCGCGNDGCLEAYASGPAIARRAPRSHRERAPRPVWRRRRRPRADHRPDGLRSRGRRRPAGPRGGAGHRPVPRHRRRQPDQHPQSRGGGDRAAASPGPATSSSSRSAGRWPRRAFKPAVQACRIVPGELPGYRRGGSARPAASWTPRWRRGFGQR